VNVVRFLPAELQAGLRVGLGGIASALCGTSGRRAHRLQY